MDTSYFYDNHTMNSGQNGDAQGGSLIREHDHIWHGDLLQGKNMSA